MQSLKKSFNGLHKIGMAITKDSSLFNIPQ